nr:C4-dicarboxylate ABC transporter [Streptomyces sp. SID5468]
MDAVTPAHGAGVMATGVLSVGLSSAGAGRLSAALLVVAVGWWLVLAVVFAARLVRRPERWSSEAESPPALTAVAATAVLGTRFALLGRYPVAWALLALAAVAWLGLLPVVLVRRGRRDAVPGSAFLVTVATEALAVPGGVLAAALRVEWPLVPSGCLLLLGLVLYALVLTRFDFGQLRDGAGDQWIFCGAVAISALAAARLDAAVRRVSGPGRPGTAVTVLDEAALALLLVSFACCLAALCCEVRWPRPRYDVRRWSTVFPLGMTASAALATGQTSGLRWAASAGRALVWVALAAWVVVAVGALRRSGRKAVTQ